MALGYLKIMFIVLVIIAGTIQILLYRSNGKSKSDNLIFVINMLFGILLSFMVYTALPNNFTWQRVLAVVWGIIAVLGFIVKQRADKSIIFSKIMFTISIVGGFIQLLI